jgi:GNAT superfamily N-acetyltransferase
MDARSKSVPLNRKIKLASWLLSHVALVAVIEEGSKSVIVGGGRYVIHEPGKTDIAFAVIDAYQGQGIGGALMRHLAGIARKAGLKKLTAEVLAEASLLYIKTAAYPEQFASTAFRWATMSGKPQTVP